MTVCEILFTAQFQARPVGHTAMTVSSLVVTSIILPCRHSIIIIIIIHEFHRDASLETKLQHTIYKMGTAGGNFGMS